MMDKKQSKYFDFAIEIVILLLVFLAPTVFDRRIGIVFSGTKTAVIRLLVLSFLTIWACKILIFREHKFVRTILDWPVVSYMFACTIATLTSVHALVSFMGFYGRYEGLSTIYVWGLLFFVVVNFIKTSEQFRRIFVTVITAATVMSIYGIIQRLGTDPYAWGGVITWQRVIATIGQPNFLAAYILMAFFFGLAILVMDKKKTLDLSGAKHDFEKREKTVDHFISQSIILLPFIGSIAAFIIMIYYVNTTIFSLLVISWLIITSLAMLFTFISRDIDPLVLDCVLIISLWLMYICILFTQSRGGFMALFGAGGLFLVLVSRDNLIFKEWFRAGGFVFRNWMKFLVLLLLFMVITVPVLFNPKYSPLKRFTEEVKVEEGVDVDKTLAPETKKDIGLELKGAAGSRIETWKSGFGIIADRPFFGIGPEVLKMIFPRYETELFRFKEAFHVKQDRCHNEVFDVGVTKGLVSLIIYSCLLFLFYSFGLRKLRGPYDNNFKIYNAAILVAATSYFIQNQFSFGVVAISTLMWIMFGMVAIPELKNDEEIALPEFKGVGISDIPWLSVAGVFVVFVLLAHLSTIQYRADRWYKNGKNDIQRGAYRNALGSFEASLKISPYEGGTMTHFAITHLNVAQGAKDKLVWHEKALRALERATLADPYNADNFYIMGKTYLSMYGLGVPDTIEKSIDMTNTAIRIDPYYAEAFHNRGIAYETMGQLEKALEDYERAYMINPNLGMSMQRLGAIYVKLGKPEVAIERFKSALERYRDNKALLENLGLMYSTLKREKEASEVFARIVELDPENVTAKLNLSLSYIRLGNLSGAKDQLLDALLLDPSNIEVHNNLGLVYSKEGDIERAVKEFKQVLILDPDNEYAKKILKSLGIE